MTAQIQQIHPRMTRNEEMGEGMHWERNGTRRHRDVVMETMSTRVRLHQTW